MMKPLTVSEPGSLSQPAIQEDYLLEGRIETFFEQQPLHFDRVRLAISEAQGTRQILLEVRFALPSQALALQHDFPDFAAAQDGVSSYAFVMKADKLQHYKPAFDQALLLDDWLETDQGAILRLENYRCIGRGTL